MSDFKISDVWFELYTGEYVNNPDYQLDDEEEPTRIVIHTAEKGGMSITNKVSITPEMKKELHSLLDIAINKTNFNLKKLLESGIDTFTL